MNAPTKKFLGLHGPKLVLTAAAVEALAVVLGLALLGIGADGLHWALRWTARFSALFFLLAFLASSLRRALHRPWTAALLRERRYWGLSFAASQAIHLGFIFWAYRHARPTMGPLDLAFYFGALGYLFTGLMALTSNDSAIRRLGPTHWRRLHSTGMSLLWFIFMATYALGASRDRWHLAMAIVFGLALVFKLGVKFGRRKT